MRQGLLDRHRVRWLHVERLVRVCAFQVGVLAHAHAVSAVCSVQVHVRSLLRWLCSHHIVVGVGV